MREVVTEGTSQGPSTDRHNDPVIDPTANVLQLVNAAMRRQDDLREADSKRQDDLRDAEARHLTTMLKQHEAHTRELRIAEKERIDAIRAVDVAAVQTANAAAEARAATLANQVATSAEAVRTNLAAALEPLQRDIADLKRSQYEAVGQKTQVVETRASGANNGLWIGVAVAAISVLVALVGIAVVLASN